ncbi:PREDICTED: RNA-binding protein 47-like [Ceratosolen solmsi marchali]|uniref:RNA-binding protein 47-like n=1 Tax=Ceratosolen solmsi marchali TaxID=326594 RepID=A0AAJ7DVP1_9HYME|nr:PREDICTED: RNA-binding protein 47-like [Ceratosolen solmsi marchali]
MSFQWNTNASSERLFDIKDKLERMTVEEKVPKLFRRMYTKKHMDLFNKKVKKPAQKNNFQDSLLNFNEQMKNIQNILELQNKFGVTIEQKNGQRKLDGRPAGSNGPQPGPGCEIFVGKIPRNIYEDVIYPIFRQVGDIYEIRLMMNFSGSNRGFCFIMYEKPEMAQRAIKELNNYQIRPGWFIGVVESVNNCRLHITDLPPQIDTKTLIKIKHALISFKTHRSAAMARRRLLPERNVFFDKSEVRIEWAHPKISVTNVHQDIKT